MNLYLNSCRHSKNLSADTLGQFGQKDESIIETNLKNVVQIKRITLRFVFLPFLIHFFFGSILTSLADG